MISGIVDKLVFGLVLIVFFQLPMLADHYQQYLNGYYDATKVEIEKIERLALDHNYSNVKALISAHQLSTLPSVRSDANNKQKMLEEFLSLENALVIFDSDSLLKKMLYMLNPSRKDTLASVIHNFEPGIPLSPTYLMYCVLAALLFNFIAASPITIILLIRRRHIQKRHLAKNQ